MFLFLILATSLCFYVLGRAAISRIGRMALCTRWCAGSSGITSPVTHAGHSRCTPHTHPLSPALWAVYTLWLSPEPWLLLAHQWQEFIPWAKQLQGPAVTTNLWLPWRISCAGAHPTEQNLSRDLVPAESAPWECCLRWLDGGALRYVVWSCQLGASLEVQAKVSHHLCSAWGQLVWTTKQSADGWYY